MGTQQSFVPRWHWILLSLALASLYLVGASSHGLLEPDEGRYANMAMEWTEFAEHDWDEPVLSDVGHFDKPPLIYWVTGTSFLLFGNSELAARLPSLLGAFLTLAGVALLAWRQYGERAAWWSVLVCGTTIHFWALAQLLSPDMLLCGFCTLGAALTLSKDKGRRGTLFWLLGALCWVLAWWTKATASLVPLAAITAAILLTRRRDLVSSLKPLRLFLIILALGSPWYIAMMLRHPELERFFFHRELVGRVTGHEDGREGFPGFHFVVALGVWLPWWPYLSEATRRGFPQWRSLPWKERLVALPWEAVAALSILTIFSFVSSKLITYTLPALPFIAVAIGSRLGQVGFSLRQWPARITVLTFVSLFAISLAFPAFEEKLGSNSSLRKVVARARASGADLMILDRYRPGAEFYFGESVVYIATKSIVQVEKARGQAPGLHFLTPGDLKDRIDSRTGFFCLVQMGDKLQPWGEKLLKKYGEGSTPESFGAFRLWILENESRLHETLPRGSSGR